MCTYRILTVLIIGLLLACTEEVPKTMQEPDHLWLEDLQSSRALDWVASQNDESLSTLQGDTRYKTLRDTAEAVYTSDDRIPYVTHSNGIVHNFWQDQRHVKGIWRSARLENYLAGHPEWQTILDIDALAAEEGEDWVYKGRTCLPHRLNNTNEERCLVHLSKGGSDAVEIREFDVHNRQFIADGFYLPEAKTRLAWLDGETLLVATDFGPNSLTESGYPRIVKSWRRGTSLSAAEQIYAAGVQDMMAAPTTIDRPEGSYTFITRIPSFFTEEIHFLDATSGDLKKLPLPESIDVKGVFDNQLIVLLRDDWVVDATNFPTGNLIAVDLSSLLSGTIPTPETVLAPDNTRAIKSISIGRDALLVSVMEHVDGVLLKLTREAKTWSEEIAPFPAHGSLDVVTNDPHSGIAMVNYESFLSPTQLYLVQAQEQPLLIDTLPDRFTATDYTAEQHFAVSKDGTRVPYYVVAPNGLTLNGSAATFISAYGGFEVPMTPSYVSALGMQWLQAGGVYVQANIRGGGEYGPAWHQAALKENRQRAFDDLYAVAEDLIARNITRPQKLAVRGGSNGGLLVTVAMTQRPDLFGAIVCAVPLIDMLRYHKLSAGASWVAEYGNPDVPAEAAYIAEYSPLQNLVRDQQYPKAFFWTNTKDDRVHPSHARRMVAQMKMLEHEPLYYENIEGGHGGGADPLALAHTTALELVFLMQALMDADSET